MAVQATLASSARVDEADKQSIEDALDVGAHKFAAIAFRVDRIDGSPTDGTVSFAIEHAVERDNFAFAALDGIDGSLLKFTVNWNDKAGQTYIEVSERFARYLRWTCTEFDFSGGADWAVFFSIELILK